MTGSSTRVVGGVIKTDSVELDLLDSDRIGERIGSPINSTSYIIWIRVGKASVDACENFG